MFDCVRVVWLCVWLFGWLVGGLVGWLVVVVVPVVVGVVVGVVVVVGGGGVVVVAVVVVVVVVLRRTWQAAWEVELRGRLLRPFFVLLLVVSLRPGVHFWKSSGPNPVRAFRPS